MKYRTNTKELKRMIEEATVDCYDEEEEFMGILYALADNLSFPFKAKALGETVEVIGIDDTNSSLGRGVIAKVRERGKEYTIGLAELEPIDDENAIWFEMYHYWLGE